MDRKLFPVQALNKNITTILNKIVTANIPGSISSGLINQINFIDEGSNITNVAEINKNPIDGNCFVNISAAYCQYLWLICDVVIKNFDLEMVNQSCQYYKISQKEFRTQMEDVFKLPKETLRFFLSQIHPPINIDQYLDYLDRMADLMDVESFENQQRVELSMLSDLVDKSKEIDFDKFKQINIQGKYEEKINSVYCYGMVFILLHELAHFSLGHMAKVEEDKEDETNADMSAFWNMQNDLNPDEMFSANCGILCVLFSFMYLNPTLKEDGVHPREDRRIFDIYELIKDDNIKYTTLVIYLFNYWGYRFNIDGYPKDMSNYIEAMNKIKLFLQNYTSTI